MEETQRNLWFRAGAVALVFAVGFVAGTYRSTGALVPNPVMGAVGADAPPEGVDFAPVWRAWNVIDEKFVPASVSSTTPVATTTEERNQERVWGMIQGLAGSLNDPYTFFLPPAENDSFNEDMSGVFEGVGMEIAVRDGVITVVSPLKGTPAERAGIKAGDKVLKIDGTDTRGMDVSAAVKRIRGPKGSQVLIRILRDTWSEPRDFEVTRDVITFPVISTEKLDGGIFVIEVNNFTANSPLLFRNALREFVESGDTKLILDLRGNPGGYLEAAVDMASWFLPSGRVVVTEDYAGHERNAAHRSRGYDIFNENLRMVILVDRGSASASEILAAALRHWGVARLVGSATFGKGSVQELVPITDETSLKITVARWLSPNGEQIPLEGIAPDVEVIVSDEDAEAGLDPQREKAVELLSQ